jgi:hypothetical protein
MFVIEDRNIGLALLWSGLGIGGVPRDEEKVKCGGWPSQWGDEAQMPWVDERLFLVQPTNGAK